ncbi:uncharacterized protein LOC135696117 isoform X2 [Rhopilema esculentum]|uniref:uncharacterized protein LOC135696117 isoform X2 n=1 Tax=Rhopilema esculentum TaxID=499914 RepID=UPI0031E3E8C3
MAESSRRQPYGYMETRLKQYRCLWDTSCRSYKDGPKKQQSWRELNQKFKKEEDTLKKVWKNLKDCFTKSIKKSASKVISMLVTQGTYFRTIETNDGDNSDIGNDELVSTEFFHNYGLDESCKYIGYSADDKRYRKASSAEELQQEKGYNRVWKKMVSLNVAFRKPSFQSSVRFFEGINLIPGFGNDGNITGKWQGCSLTENDENPFWQVDLLREAYVTSVRVKSTEGWGSGKINSFSVSVGNDRSEGGRKNPLCVTNGQVDKGQLKKFDCDNLLVGRFVSLFINRKEYLPDCEVEVYEGNIAYKKPSSQSSTSTIESIPLVARFANDGNRTGDWQGCSITKADVTPWWQVDLTRQAAVASVQIRSGATWGQLKINPFDVSVGDDSSNGGRNNALCVKEGRLASGELKKFDCPQVLMGRYVSVYLNRKEFLQVCEVEVYEDVF